MVFLVSLHVSNVYYMLDIVQGIVAKKEIHDPFLLITEKKKRTMKYEHHDINHKELE